MAKGHFTYFSLVMVCVISGVKAMDGRTIPSKSCQPPSTCTEVRQCPYFAKILDSNPIPRPSWLAKLLKEHHCGFHDDNPKVCCTIPNQQKSADDVASLSLHPNLRLLPRLSTCGRVFNDNVYRIVRGSKAALLEYPWMALLVFRTANGIEPKCGGTLINNRYVLTAAHCVVNTNLTLVGVRLGEYNLNTEKDCEQTTDLCLPPVQDVYIEEVVVHPNYQPKNFENDIALIRLATTVNLTYESTQPICLPLGKAAKFNFAGKPAVVTGWGVTENGYNSAELLKVSLPIIPNDKCTKIHANYATIANSQICAGGILGKDSCSGDSGGPLKFIVEDGSGGANYVQYGIVSYGPADCGRPGHPGVYTNVKYYEKWILDHLKPSLER